MLTRSGDYAVTPPSGVFGDATRAALRTYAARVNLEERVTSNMLDGDAIDAVALRSMREHDV